MQDLTAAAVLWWWHAWRLNSVSAIGIYISYDRFYNRYSDVGDEQWQVAFWLFSAEPVQCLRGSLLALNQNLSWEILDKIEKCRSERNMRWRSRRACRLAWRLFCRVQEYQTQMDESVSAANRRTAFGEVFVCLCGTYSINNAHHKCAGIRWPYRFISQVAWVYFTSISPIWKCLQQTQKASSSVCWSLYDKSGLYMTKVC